MFQRILVPLDGSSRAERALPIAARIARSVSGSVLLVRVVNAPIDYGGGLAPVPYLSEQVIKSEMDSAAAYLRAVAEQMLKGINTSTQVLFGMPAQCIKAVATEEHTDLIVLCSHGRTGFARWTLGSVAHTLAHESAVPTLILRDGDLALRPPALPAPWPICALVPLDGSALAETALLPASQLVAALAAPATGVLHLAQVVQPVQETTTGSQDGAAAHASTYLTRSAERLLATTRDLQLAVTWSVLPNHDVAGALVHLAEQAAEGQQIRREGSSDLIAISTHGRQGLERWVIGSVTDRVLNATRLPMLIVRPPKKG
jgi:nucleotide-binding universal stress UspA family protein